MLHLFSPPISSVLDDSVDKQNCFCPPDNYFNLFWNYFTRRKEFWFESFPNIFNGKVRNHRCINRSLNQALAVVKRTEIKKYFGGIRKLLICYVKAKKNQQNQQKQHCPLKDFCCIVHRFVIKFQNFYGTQKNSVVENIRFFLRLSNIFLFYLNLLNVIYVYKDFGIIFLLKYSLSISSIKNLHDKLWKKANMINKYPEEKPQVYAIPIENLLSVFCRSSTEADSLVQWTGSNQF